MCGALVCCVYGLCVSVSVGGQGSWAQCTTAVQLVRLSLDARLLVLLLLLCGANVSVTWCVCCAWVPSQQQQGPAVVGGHAT